MDATFSLSSGIFGTGDKTLSANLLDYCFPFANPPWELCEMLAKVLDEKG